MKKIINGKKYDTETAKDCGYWESIPDTRDLYYVSETLYQKRNGEFFLYGSGNAGSKYAEAIGTNEWSGGSRIMPMTYGEAQQWAEEHLSGDEYENIFGEIPEDTNDKRYLNVYLPNVVIETARREAAKSGISVSAYIESLIM